MIIVIIILTIVVLTMICFIFYGLFSKPKLSPILLETGDGPMNYDCLSQQVTCDIDTDCENKCIQVSEGQEMYCVKVGDQNTGYCANSQPTIQCNKQNGGLLVWSGNNNNTMEWDCLCSYPNYFSSSDCGTLNNDICNPGTFTWDATQGSPPSSDNCKCAAGYTKMIRKYTGDSPICVPTDKCSFYLDTAICPTDNQKCC